MNLVIYKDYVEQAKREGKKVETKYANGIRYLFVFETDGWISIMEVPNYGDYKPIVQAKDVVHAESYINMIETISAPFVVI